MTNYKELAKKHGLPEFSEINKYFDIETIEDNHMSLKAIAKKIGDKVETFAKILENILQPENDLSSMYECNAFNDDDKKDVFDIYKRLLYLHRKQNLLELEFEDASGIEFIKQSFSEWKELKKQIEKLMIKMQDSWNKKSEKKGDPGYFG